MATRVKKLGRDSYQARKCRYCGKIFRPVTCHQQFHVRCFPLWRRRYFRNYQRRNRGTLKETNGQEKRESEIFA